MNLSGKRNMFLKGLFPIFELISRTGLTPNQISYLSFFLGLVSVYFFYQANYFAGAYLLFLHGLLDISDGYIARKKGLYSVYGGFLDGMVDRYINGLVIGAITVSLVGVETLALPIGVIAVVASLCNSFSKPCLYAEANDNRKEKGKIKHPMDSVGFFGLVETDLIIFLFSTYSLFFGQILMFYALIVLAIAENISLLQRVFFVYGNYKR